MRTSGNAFLFPLLKKPLFFLLCLAPIALSLITGFLYLPAKASDTSSFEEDRSAIEEALTAAKQKAENAAEGEKALFEEEVFFYEAALNFHLSPWSSYFASEGLSAYANLLAAGGSAEDKEALEQILLLRDQEGLLSYLDGMRQKSGGFSPEELARKIEEDKLLLSSDDPSSPGQSAVLHDIRLLKESLDEGRDLYFGSDHSLSQKETKQFQSLLEKRKSALINGDYDPVPANKETLFWGERITSLFLSLLMLLLLGKASPKKENGCLRALFLPGGICLLLILLCSLSLWMTTAIHAPGTLQNTLFWTGSDFLSLPFFPALFLRLLCRVLTDAPWLLLCFFLRTKKNWGKDLKLLAFPPLIRFLLQAVLPLLPESTVKFGACLDLAENLFPSWDAYSLHPRSPFAAITLLLLFSALCLYSLAKRKKDEL